MTYQLLHGDCITEMDHIAANTIDMVCADLTFGTTSNAWETKIDLTELWKQFKRITKPHAAIVLFSAQPFTSQLVMSNLRGYKHKWTWNKRQAGNFAVAKHMPLTVDEDVLVFTAHGARANYYPIMRKGKLRMKGGKASLKNGRGFGGLKNISYLSDEYYPTSILEFPSVPRTQRLHSAQKPVALLEYLIRTYSVEGDTVLDCTFGSCSTGVACQNTNRDFIGIELLQEFYDIGVKRMNETKEPTQ